MLLSLEMSMPAVFMCLLPIQARIRNPSLSYCQSNLFVDADAMAQLEVIELGPAALQLLYHGHH